MEFILSVIIVFLSTIVILLVFDVRQLRAKNKKLSEIENDRNDWMFTANHWHKKYTSQGVFTEKELVFILKRCHPDINSNSPMANVVSAKLIEMRGK